MNEQESIEIIAREFSVPEFTGTQSLVTGSAYRFVGRNSSLETKYFGGGVDVASLNFGPNYQTAHGGAGTVLCWLWVPWTIQFGPLLSK